MSIDEFYYGKVNWANGMFIDVCGKGSIKLKCLIKYNESRNALRSILCTWTGCKWCTSVLSM